MSVAKVLRHTISSRLMTRLARVTIPGIPHHVTQRGNRRQDTFFCPSDFQLYLKFLETASVAHEFDIWAFCLMTNHVHLLLVPHKERSLSDGIGQIHHDYTLYVNKQREWKGHLWQGRFFSCPIQPERAALVARYIELNPVRAGLSNSPLDYQWSSARESCGKIAGLTKSPLITQVGNWQEFLHGPLDQESDFKQIRRMTNTGRVFGSDKFISELEQRTGRILSIKKRGPKPAQFSKDGHLSHII